MSDILGGQEGDQDLLDVLREPPPQLSRGGVAVRGLTDVVDLQQLL